MPTPQPHFSLSFLSQLTHYEPLNSNAPIIKLEIDSDTESDVELISLPYKTLKPYSDQTYFQTNTHLTPWDELFQQFEGEVVSRLDTLTEVCTSNANLYEVCVMTSFEEVGLLCLKEAKSNFHAKLWYS